MTVHASKPGNLLTFCGQLIRKSMHTVRYRGPRRSEWCDWKGWAVIDDPDLSTVTCPQCLDHPEVQARAVEQALS